MFWFTFYALIILHSVSANEYSFPFISNYGRRCMRCICEASSGGCDIKLSCEKGYCGPFQISRIEWTDAGNVTFSADDPERNNIYMDCSVDYTCSQKILLGYFQRYGRDCNGDGVTNCDDYAMLHFNGRRMCHLPINRSEFGRNWWRNYTECDPLDRRTFS